MNKFIFTLMSIILIFSCFNFSLATDDTTSYLYTNESGELIHSDEYEYADDAIYVDDLEDIYDYEDSYDSPTSQEDLKNEFETQSKEFSLYEKETENEKVVITEILSDIKSEYTTDYYYYYIINYQLVNIRTADGKESPAAVILSYDVADNKNLKPLKAGDTVYAYVEYMTPDDPTYNMINHGLTTDEIAFVSITEQDRNLGVILLTIFTILLLVLYAGKHGTKLLIPLFVAIDLIFIVLIPELEIGKNLILLTCLISLELIILITVLKNGISRKTLVAIISSIMVVVLLTALGTVFADTNNLIGKGLITEEKYDLYANVYYIDHLFKTKIDTPSIYTAMIILITSVIAASISSKITELSEKYAGSKNMTNNIIEESKQIISEYPMIIAIIFMAVNIPNFMIMVYNHTAFAHIMNSEVLVTNLSLLLISIISVTITSPITAVVSKLLMGEVEIKQIEDHK